MALADTRDTLALERTRLANERTFLAYVRTALSLIAAGAVLLQFFAKHPSYVAVAWILVVSGGLTLLVGLYRFFSVRARLNGNDS
jgi:inner membrane protein YidH